MAWVLLVAASRGTAEVSTNTLFPAAGSDQGGVVSEPEPDSWAFSVAAFAYSVPDDGDYVQPIVTADRDGLHLEARYNYESLDSGSVWLGYNFNGGEGLAWEVTPMLGGVFGDVAGVAPGYKYTLGWSMLELYSEGEYVIDTDNTSDSFFYSWSELTLSPLEGFRFGLVMQRTRVYESDREIQGGVLVGFTHEWMDLSAYVLGPEDDKPIYVVAVALDL